MMAMGGGMGRNLLIQLKRSGFTLKGVFFTAVLVSLFACAFPGIKRSAIKSEDVMDFVDKNYDNLIITYSAERGSPTAIRFDFKNDDVTLTGDAWSPVQSKAQVQDMIRDFNARYRRYSMGYRGPHLFEIQSAEGRVVGYFYCLLVQLNLRDKGNNIWMGPVTEADLKDEREVYSIKSGG
jgi:hypothetical protein